MLSQEDYKASIEYWPICNHCHAILRWVDYREMHPPVEGSKALMSLAAEIEPYKCPNCGRIFESIKFATHFPFDGY